MRHFVGLSVCVALVGCTTQAPKQTAVYGPIQPTSFACPAEGLKTRTVQDFGPILVRTWHGSDPSDPVLCNVGNGKALYGWLGGVENNKVAHDVFAAAFAGNTGPKCFERITTQNQYGGATASHEFCMSQLGTTKILINGQEKSVVAFDLNQEGRFGNYFAADFTLYYDPQTHLFLETDVAMERGDKVAGWKRSIL